jgi:hypothetical protein
LSRRAYQNHKDRVDILALSRRVYQNHNKIGRTYIATGFGRVLYSVFLRGFVFSFILAGNC